jgi:hypothetical protein
VIALHGAKQADQVARGRPVLSESSALSRSHNHALLGIFHRIVLAVTIVDSTASMRIRASLPAE